MSKPNTKLVVNHVLGSGAAFVINLGFEKVMQAKKDELVITLWPLLFALTWPEKQRAIGASMGGAALYPILRLLGEKAFDAIGQSAASELFQNIQ